MTCPECERHKLSAAMWRNEAYKRAGVELPWKPEDLVEREFQRGFAEALSRVTQPQILSTPKEDK